VATCQLKPSFHTIHTADFLRHSPLPHLTPNACICLVPHLSPPSILPPASHPSQVYDTPRGHVTRDYREGLGQLADLAFRLLDTSGLEPAAHPATLQVRVSLAAQIAAAQHI
jgi:hypothetical protein